MSKSTMKAQHRNLQQLMRSHQLTPEWENQNGRVLIAPGITVLDSIQDAKATRDIVLDENESGRYIFLGMSGPAGKRAQLRKVAELIETLELEEAAALLRELQQNLETLSQEVAAARKA